MKKIQSILSAMLLFVVCAVLCVGCGSNSGSNKGKDDAPTTMTITLAEAKEIIVKALAITELKPAATTETGNRDLLEKMGKFTLTSETLSGTLSYQNGDYQQYLLSTAVGTADDDSTFDYYYDGKHQYLHYDGTTVPKNSVEGMANKANGNVGGAQTAILDNMAMKVVFQYLGVLKGCFSDEAFASCYDDNVEKVGTKDNYTLTLKMDYDALLKLVLDEATYDSAVAALGDLTQWQALVVLSFDGNHQINAAKLTFDVWGMNEDGTSGMQTTNMTVNKFDGEIEQPQWLTDYLASQN